MDGAENIGAQIEPTRVKRMVAVGKTLTSESLEEEAVCSACFGTGMVSHWSEIAYFEDRRACSRCEAGCRVDTKIADIIKLARLEERLSRV
jgi:hypothetical protein